MSTAAVSYCHAHIHQTYYVGLSATYIYNTGKRTGTRKTTDGYKYASAVYQSAASCGVTHQRNGRSSAAVSDSVLTEWLNRDRGDNSSEQVTTLAQKVNVQFCKSVWPQVGRRQPPREQTNACNTKTEGLLQESSLPPVRAAGYLPSLFQRIA